MIRKLIALLILSLATACGADDAGPNDVTDVDDASADAVELGTAEQPIFAPRGNTYVLGSTTSQSALRCTTTSSSQVCDVPTRKTYTYCSTGLTALENGLISAVATGGSNQTAPFRFQTTDSGLRDAACDAAFNAGTVQILINAANNICGAAGAPATNIDSLVCGTPSVVTGTLPEVPSVPGSFRGIAGGVIHLDRARLAAAFTTGTQNWNLVSQHGLAHQAARFRGLGARTENPFALFLWTYRPVQPISTIGRTFTKGEECVTNFYSATGGTNYTTDSVSCTGSAGSPE